MNEILQALHARKSMRVFEDKPVAPEIRGAILDAAIQAPTAGNQCLYTILNITDGAIKDRLAVLCDDQPFIATAPLVLIFLADCRRWLDSYHFSGEDARPPAESDLMLAVADAVIAAQNSVVAADSLGLGSCYIGDVVENEEEMRTLLKLDDYVFPAAMLVYGYPTRQQQERKKPTRYAREYLVFDNHYQRLTKQQHIDMLDRQGSLHNKDFQSYVSAFCRRKYMSGFSAEMARSVKRYLRHFTGE